MKAFFLVLIFSFGPILFAQDVTIKQFNGNISYRDQIVTKDTVLEFGHSIEAIGRNSFVILTYTDGSQVMLKNGSLKLRKMDKVTKNKVNIIELIRGMLFAYKNPDSKGKLYIKTKHAAMGVRGTKFYVGQSEEDTYLCVCKGQVDVYNDIGQLTILKGEDIHIKRSESLSKIKANDMMMTMAYEGFEMMGISVE